MKSDSSTSLNRLVHLFGYDLHALSNEQTVISMRFAIRISKGITLSCCYPIQLSRNRRPRKGGNPARPSRPCQAGSFQLPEANPFDADTPTARICCWERSAEKLLRLPLAGTGDCMFRPSLCQLPQVSLTTQSRTSLFHSAKIASGLVRRSRGSPFRLCTNCCADSSYRSFSKDPVPLRDQPERPW